MVIHLLQPTVPTEAVGIFFGFGPDTMDVEVSINGDVGVGGWETIIDVGVSQ